MMNFKLKFAVAAIVFPLFMNAQNVMTPEIMWSLRKLGVSAASPENDQLIYKVSQTDMESEKSTHNNFMLELKSNKISGLDLGKKSLIQWDKNGLYAKEDDQIFVSKDKGKSWTSFFELKDAGIIKISPDGKKIAFSREVQLDTVHGKDKYDDTPNATVQIYEDLGHRHWDHWGEGKFNHIFVVNVTDGKEAIDLLEGKHWHTPQQPFGGAADFVWSPDSEEILYVVKPFTGVEYMTSTNSDIFAYNTNSGQTRNLTSENKGYDNHPVFSPDGKFLLYTSMARDGYEADKNDLKIIEWATGKKSNLTENWDESITGDMAWSPDSKQILFTAAYRGTKQLFAVNPKTKAVKQITEGKFDVNQIYAPQKNKVVVSRTDMNHNADLYSVNLVNGEMTQLTDVNGDIYATVTPSETELKMIQTADGKDMGVWFIYPPDFDPNKKYPTLLYCQGGPQSPLTQFFSTRWNFALMAANGYVVVAPNRRGMQGWGTEWNEAISKDWGGMPVQDYLAAADYAAQLPFVDKDRMGAVGASYGGYSVYMLAGLHEGRFKTFIAHNGLFDMKSWYGMTEELFFANWDAGSPWDNPLPKAYTDFNPSNHVQKWDTPIMIVQGGMDFRVPYEQGNQAFQYARLKGLKSKFVYFPDENHWVLKPHNALIWHREFFAWLKETL